MLIVEVGGTVGDIESLPFLEAIRQFRADVGRDNVCYVHLALVPFIATAGELKTKPRAALGEGAAQRSASRPTSCCAAPTASCRSSVKAKIALFCNVDEDAVITAKDVEHDLRGAAALPRGGRSTRRSPRCSASGPGARTSRTGRSSSQRASRTRSARCGSRWSASTST